MQAPQAAQMAVLKCFVDFRHLPDDIGFHATGRGAGGRGAAYPQVAQSRAAAMAVAEGGGAGAMAPPAPPGRPPFDRDSRREQIPLSLSPVSYFLDHRYMPEHLHC